MKIEVWKSGLGGPRQVASSIWVILSGNQPSVRFARWSFDYVSIASDFAAQALGGKAVVCPYSNTIAIQNTRSAEYFLQLVYDPVFAAKAIRVTCRLCGYGVLERGEFQLTPHLPRTYVVAPRRSARITAADFRFVSDHGYFAKPQRAGRLIVCRYGGGLFTHVPKWVLKKFEGANLLDATPTYTILEMPL